MSQYDHHAQQDFKDMLYLDGLFFLKESTIRENTELVQQTFQDMFQHIRYN